MLAQQLWASVIGPLLLGPLLQPPPPPPDLLSPRGAAAAAAVPGGFKSGPPQPSCALFVLERIFLLLDYRPLVNNLALALFGQRPSSSCRSSAAGAPPPCPHLGRLSPLVADLSEGGQHHPLDPAGCARFGSCREALVAVLRGGSAISGSGPLAASGAIRMLVAAARCACLSWDGRGGGGLLLCPALNPPKLVVVLPPRKYYL